MPELSDVARAIRTGVFAELEGAIAERRGRGGDIVPLHIGDTHRAPPAQARYERAIEGATDEALYAYGATAGVAELRDAIAAGLEARGRGLPGMSGEAHVLVGAGATHALSCAVRAVVGPGDEVALASPYWPLAHGILASAGARIREVPLTSRLYEDPSLDAAEILAAGLGPRTRALYLITPNNPDGKVLSAAQLAAVARLAVERDLWVIADEVYADYTYQGEHVSVARLPGMAERTITAYSLSKSHALAGARIGYAVAPAEVVRAARRVSVHSVFNVPVVAQRAALGAVRSGAAWMSEARQDYVAARDAAAAALEGSGVRFHLAEGGVYLFLDFRELLGDRPLRALMEPAIERGVLLAPGEAFGAGFERFARLCYTSVPRARVVEGIRRLREALGALG